MDMTNPEDADWMARNRETQSENEDERSFRRRVLDSIMGNARYEAGDRVDTPDNGYGVVDDRITEGTIPGTDLEPSSDSPVYAVATEDSGVEFYKASDLEAVDEFPVDDDVRDQGKDEVASSNREQMANDWSMPPSWRKSETPSRLILLDAWADMNGQFDAGGAGCMGDLHSKRMCAAMKDEVLGTEDWRGGWAE